MVSKYGKKRSFEQEHWYVTNIDHISLKASTTEGMGEIGEEKGLAVYALATLKN